MAAPTAAKVLYRKLLPQTDDTAPQTIDYEHRMNAEGGAEGRRADEDRKVREAYGVLKLEQRRRAGAKSLSRS